jgi:erythromycin esterase
VIGSLFYMYATSRQMLSLFDYVQRGLQRDQTLVIAGFESQHTGLKAKTQLFGDFEKFLQQMHPAPIDSSWRLFRRVSVAMFGSRDYRPGEEEKKIFFQELDALKSALAGRQQTGGRPAGAGGVQAGTSPAMGQPTGGERTDSRLDGAPINTGRADNHERMDSLTGSAGFWYQVVCSIESQALRYWQLVKGNEVSVRDRQMAENLIWLAEKAYPGKKIIVWAHNVHIAKSLTSLGPVADTAAAGQADKSTAGRAVDASGNGQADKLTAGQPAAADPNVFVPMGVTIRRHFGVRSYHIGFSGVEGSYMDYTDSHIIVVPPKPAGHIEGMVTATGHPYVFIDFHSAPASYRQKQPASLADYGDLSGLWPEVFDGLFVIKKIFPVERTGR